MTSARKPRVLAALLAVFSLIIVSIVALPSAARAAQNPDIVVSDVTLTSETGEPPIIGDVLTLTGTWDASQANPQPGDEFVVGLPGELGFEGAIPFALDGPTSDGDVVTWANCITDPASGIMTCTLTDAVVDYPEAVRGTFELEVTAVETTTEERLVFDLNGEDIAVDIPGEGGIGDGIELSDEWSKTGSLNSDKWSMTWTIELPGSRLAGEDVIHILEDVSDNHMICEPSKLKIETVRGDTVVDVTQIGSIGEEVEDPYDFEIVLTAPESGFSADVTYRIRYQTCTPDGEIDPKGTEYTNEATVDIWGESSGVIGVGQDWLISDTISKSGSVLGGAERNGTIRWTITVPGDVVFGKDSFTLSEQLTGAHAVCADTIDDLRVFERYGPSGSRQSEITDELTVTTIDATDDSFEIEITPDRELRASDWMYVLQYETCATTDGLPEAGTPFGNDANIDGHVDGSQATVPSRTDSKTGGLNGSTITIDGVEHLPQTTMNWNITVPGEKLAEIDGPLTVTDTLSGAHMVCTAGGGDLRDRLNLTVQARDQIQGGGLATVDLSDQVVASQDGDELTFEIARPTLPLPDGSSTEGFSREYQYVITYTTCTSSGGMDAPGTSYGNDATVAGSHYERTVTQNYRGSGTGQGMNRGTVAVTKALADTPGAAFVPADTTFSVHVKEIGPDSQVHQEYDLEVPLDGDPVSGFNARGNGWTIELSEPTFPKVPGVVFGAPVFAEADGVTVSEDGTVATAALTPATNVEVQLTNTALLGSVAIEKVLEGGAADLVSPDRTYEVTAAIDTTALGEGFPAQEDRTVDVAVGEPAVLEDLPVGATVTFTETPQLDDDAFTWGEPTIDPGEIIVAPASVDEPAVVTVTNPVERTVGTFSLAKSLTGAEADNPAAPSEFLVTATWNEEGVEGEKTLALPADGTPVAFGEDLLIGTEVTLVESVPADGQGIAWADAIWTGTGVSQDGESAVVTVTRDADAAVVVENHAATSTAGISLLKGVAGEAAGEVDGDAEFPVVATWADADGEMQSVELMIDANEPTPLGVELPAGTVVTLTEGEAPEYATVDWGSIAISGPGVDDAGDGSATVVVSDQQDDVALITVVNEATWAPGGFSLAKSVEGILLDDPSVPGAVSVTATWADADGAEQTADIEVPTDGTVVEFPQELPHGTIVTLAEDPLESDARFTWAEPTWAGERVEAVRSTATVTIGAAEVAAVELTNTALPTLGSLALVKQIEGTGAEAAADMAFPVTLTWTDLLGDEQSRDVTVTAGETTTLDELPLGTEVTLVEGDAELPADLGWESATWAASTEAATVVAGGDGAQVTVSLADTASELTLTNHMIDETVALATAADDSELSATGDSRAIAWALGAAGVLALVAGLALYLIRRRLA